MVGDTGFVICDCSFEIQIDRSFGYSKTLGWCTKNRCRFRIHSTHSSGSVLIALTQIQFMMNIKPIKTKKDYEQAMHRLEYLFNAKKGTSKGDELKILSFINWEV